MVQEIAEICSIGVQKDRKDGNVEAMVQEMNEICSNGAEMGGDMRGKGRRWYKK
jgi:hypothetical protein